LSVNDTLIISGLMQLGEDKAVQIKNVKSN